MAIKKIIAAGGLVINEKNEMLFIFRRGKWDLPKGKLDEGETIEICAVREVKEETGLQHVLLKQFIGITKHAYFDIYLQEDVIKESHWYSMITNSKEILIPQTEEDISAIQWVAKKDMETLLTNSFESIVSIINQYYTTQ